MTLLPTLSAIALIVLAAVGDLRTRRIPNRLVLALAAVGALRLVLALASGLAPVAAALDVLAALAVFAVGAGAFALRFLGGGDVKLLAAAALWLGAAALPKFLLATAIAGGLLAALYLALPTRAREKGLPYGVAIAAGALVAILPAT